MGSAEGELVTALRPTCWEQEEGSLTHNSSCEKMGRKLLCISFLAAAHELGLEPLFAGFRYEKTRLQRVFEQCFRQTPKPR